MRVTTTPTTTTRVTSTDLLAALTAPRSNDEGRHAIVAAFVMSSYGDEPADLRAGSAVAATPAGARGERGRRGRARRAGAGA